MDIRRINTQARLKEGFFLLLSEKNLSECTISDIVEYAKVSKKTFYNYYQNKKEFLIETERDLLSGLKNALLVDREEFKKLDHKPTIEEIEDISIYGFDATLRYCDQYKVQFSRLLSSNGDMFFYKNIVKIGMEELDYRFPYLFGEEKLPNRKNILPLSFVKTIYVETIINLLVHWGKNSNSMSISDVKSLVGIIQTKSPVELIRLSQIE